MWNGFVTVSATTNGYSPWSGISNYEGKNKYHAHSEFPIGHFGEWLRPYQLLFFGRAGVVEDLLAVGPLSPRWCGLTHTNSGLLTNSHDGRHHFKPYQV